MPGYNKQFELSVDDLELIEDALRRSKRELSAPNHDEIPSENEDAVREIHDLLGRIHNQKIFYRPSNTTYISG
ncbi:hypothetical protein [Roseovarius indicus]|uniref:Uncharacterized protein n=1 Tax=Roseovarius indicus TaxID=540747 RepID=A0A0T5P5C6_9RHOB|nr:hypothetical protein [Roseovarius indicus]KRS16300.1 hypothetical protein XM52_19795 [Roseovarius indicus]OAO02282.1 hypothetical protein A8B76_18305 [Roseovarius indicus]QEW27518.1 hypothetical protein RIdsm_03334 [Roseovarius indicus]SFD46870.1 hypothetical protein SAMN04488031_10111 [Roseovarius indicus]